MPTNRWKLARRISKIVFDGTLGFLMLPVIVFVLWEAVAQTYNAYHALPGWLEDLANSLFGHSGYAPVVLIVAPFGFPFVAFLSYRYQEFRWRRDWWFVLIGELLLGLVYNFLLALLPVWQRDLDFWAAGAATALFLPVLWFLYRVLRIPRKPRVES